MAICGVICEYNPFHLGHKKQFEMLRAQLGADTAIVCLMSGNFVQRGEPAVFDKQVRARAAIEAGADLVLELPVTCCLNSAEGFAAGGIEILTRLGCVDTLGFGCECGSEEKLMLAARAMLRPDFDEAMREALTSGCSYAAARQRALAALGADASVLEQPNDILGVEYCLALLRQESAIRSVAILREGDYHDVTADAENPSATSLRALLLADGDWRGFVPACAAPLYKSAPRHALEFGTRAMLARLRTASETEWEACAHGSEGLWSKAMKAARVCDDLPALIAAVKSKRYPQTRIQRLLLCAFLGISQKALAATPEYVRVLGFSEVGRAALHTMKKSAAISIVNAGERPNDAAYFELEQRAALLYRLFCEPGRSDAWRLEEEVRVFRKTE